MPETLPDRDPWAVKVADAFREARKTGLSVDEAADIVVAVLREQIDAHAGEETTSPDDVILMQSILSARSGDPLVQVKCGPLRWQWTVEDTRRHAARLVETAEAAEHDAAFYRWATLGELDLSPRQAAEALNDLRRFRGDVDRTDWRNG